MIKLNCFTNILNNFDHLKGSGILTEERITEAKEYISDKNFVPAELKDGRKIKNWILHEPSGTIWANTTKYKDGWSHYVLGEVLSYFFTEEEVVRINEDASSYYSSQQEKRRFEKAEKIPAAEWPGPVFYGDEYYASIDDFLDWVECERDNSDEFIMPTFVWACDDIKPVCQLNTYDIIESATEEAFEGFETNQLVGIKELEAAIEKFNELNKDQVFWSSNEKIAVIL